LYQLVIGESPSALTGAALSWQPEQPGLLADLDRPGYFGPTRALAT